MSSITTVCQKVALCGEVGEPVAGGDISAHCLALLRTVNKPIVVNNVVLRKVTSAL